VIRIALDAMGGDNAPDVEVEGSLQALAEHPPGSIQVLLVGRRADIEESLARHGQPPDRIPIVDAPEVVGMAEKPLAAVRGKPKSSIAVGLGLQKRGEADAFISAGNTGAVMAASTLLLGLHPGVDRAAIGALFPTSSKPVLVIDAGANVDCSARELYGFAHIGAVYARDVLGRPEPVVGLLNIGEEEEKGNSAVKETFPLLKDSQGFRFVGNVEGRDILRAECDVVVCDGFVGNVVLKFYESVARLFRGLLEREMEPDVLESPGARRVFKVLDYSEYGGAPLLGIRGVSIICHGSSPPNAIKNAIRVAAQAVRSHLSQHIGAEFAGDGAVA
jgi:glycerol-3-phosphate acyltransferase PlsX